MRTEFLCIYVLRVASGPRVKLVSCKSALNPPMVCSTDRSKAVVPVLVLLRVALWFILRGDLLYVFLCVILFLCFSVLLVLRLPRLGKRELILVLLVRLFGLCLFRFVGFLFLLGSGKGCGLWLWHSLDFSLTFFGLCCVSHAILTWRCRGVNGIPTYGWRGRKPNSRRRFLTVSALIRLLSVPGVTWAVSTAVRNRLRRWDRHMYRSCRRVVTCGRLLLGLSFVVPVCRRRWYKRVIVDLLTWKFLAMTAWDVPRSNI